MTSEQVNSCARAWTGRARLVIIRPRLRTGAEEPGNSGRAENTMRVDVREAGRVIIVDLRGRLVAGTGDELLRDVINELLAEGWKQILLNLTEVEKIDSNGVGELVAGRKLARRFGSTLRLLVVPGRVHQVLEMGHILPVFRVFDNESEAVASFEDDG